MKCTVTCALSRDARPMSYADCLYAYYADLLSRGYGEILEDTRFEEFPSSVWTYGSAEVWVILSTSKQLY